MTQNAGAEGLQVNELSSVLWRHRGLVAVGVALGLLAATAYLHVATYRYTVDLRVTPAGQSRSSIAGKLGGLASLAGVNLPSDPGRASFSLYLQGYKSREVANLLARDQNLMRALFPREWDMDRQQWVEPKGVGRTVTRFIKRLLGFPTKSWTPPGGDRLQDYLDTNIQVDEARDNEVVKISIDMKDPRLGADLLWRLHKTIDDVLRQQALTRSSKYVEYLTHRFQTVTIDEYRQALIQTVAEQEKMRMIASSNPSFAAEPFGRPSSSIMPTKPNPGLVLLIGLLCGSMLGIVAAFIRHSFPGRLSPSDN